MNRQKLLKVSSIVALFALITMAGWQPFPMRCHRAAIDDLTDHY